MAALHNYIAAEGLRPHGRSGLKYGGGGGGIGYILSPPTRAEWVEMTWPWTW